MWVREEDFKLIIERLNQIERSIMTTKEEFIAQLQVVTTQLTTAQAGINALIAAGTGTIPDDVVAAFTPLQTAAAAVANIAPPAAV